MELNQLRRLFPSYLPDENKTKQELGEIFSEYCHSPFLYKFLLIKMVWFQLRRCNTRKRRLLIAFSPLTLISVGLLFCLLGDMQLSWWGRKKQRQRQHYPFNTWLLALAFLKIRLLKQSGSWTFPSSMDASKLSHADGRQGLGHLPSMPWIGL